MTAKRSVSPILGKTTMRYRAILFDLDGALVPSLPLWLKAFRKALGLHGIAVSDDEVVGRCLYRGWDDVAVDFGILFLPAAPRERLIEVGHEVFGVLYPDGESEEGIRYADPLALLGRYLRVGCSGRAADERLHSSEA